MRDIRTIIIHCSDTPPEMDIGAEEIRGWHVQDNGWADIGYHGVIRRNGAVESGRKLDTPGAHCRGQNANSVGICLIGGRAANGQPENNFTPEQFAALARQIRGLKARWPDARVAGHCDFDPGKACPCFDAGAWWAAQASGKAGESRNPAVEGNAGAAQIAEGAE